MFYVWFARQKPLKRSLFHSLPATSLISRNIWWTFLFMPYAIPCIIFFFPPSHGRGIVPPLFRGTITTFLNPQLCPRLPRVFSEYYGGWGSQIYPRQLIVPLLFRETITPFSFINLQSKICNQKSSILPSLLILDKSIPFRYYCFALCHPFGQFRGE